MKAIDLICAMGNDELVTIEDYVTQTKYTSRETSGNVFTLYENVLDYYELLERQVELIKIGEYSELIISVI